MQNNKLPYPFNNESLGYTEVDFKKENSQKFIFENNFSFVENIYKYESFSENGSTFYFINIELNVEQLKEIHLRIFSEDKADFYLIKNNNDSNFKVVYAKSLINEKSTKIPIYINPEDEDLLQSISKASVDSGAFWLYHSQLLENSKTKSIRDELVNVLTDLRAKLLPKVKNEELVHALIDRTLFIKFLEDKHIINSRFYGDDVNFKNILLTGQAEKVNELFTNIHTHFNSYLFEEPTIPNDILNKDVLEIIKNSIEGNQNGQFTLFDLKFDIIPIEALSQIYEIFFELKQRKNGIYYTPKVLTDFIVNKTINQTGRIIDPACGSGAFLISAFKKILFFSKNSEPNDVVSKIQFRLQLIRDNIFGIEKEPEARRLTIFALYLIILEDLSLEENQELKAYIEANPYNQIFNIDIRENILCCNTLEANIFDIEKFDFVIGNPPWKKDLDEPVARKYYEENKKDFSGKPDISQLFMHKAKIWENDNTIYGFVVNTSNFINDSNDISQDYFYQNFTIENLIEVTELDLFTAKEPAIVCIYKKKIENETNIILNVVKSNNLFKALKKIIIIEEDNIEIIQNNLLKSDNPVSVSLRSYIIGNKGDWDIISYLENTWFEKISNYILKDDGNNYFIKHGILVFSKSSITNAKNLTKQEVITKKNEFYENYTSKIQNKEFPYPFLKVKNIDKFQIKEINKKNKIELYLSENISNLWRSRSKEINEGNRILLPRTSDKLKAVYIESNQVKFYPTDHFFVIKVQDSESYFLTAILNSMLLEYYLKVKYWKRTNSGFPSINENAIINLPIPIFRDKDLVQKISDLSSKLTKKEIEYEEVKEEMNNLIFDLYGIGVLEKQRIKDFFIKNNEKVKKNDLENYAQKFLTYLNDYLKPDLKINSEVYEADSILNSVSIVKIYFGDKNEHYPNSNKVSKYIISDILKSSDNNGILSLRKRFYGKNTIYIIKDNLKKSWSLTKAGEDAVSELDKIFKRKAKKY